MEPTRDLSQYGSRFQDRQRAANYARRFDHGSRKRVDQREQRALRRILATLPEVRRVLDVPCGAGRFVATLGADNRHVVEMDIATEILEHARNRAQQAGVQAEFTQGDASRLSFPDQSVDLVFCNRLLHHILSAPDRGVILREFCRVTRRFAVLSFFDYHSFGAIRRLLKRLKGRQPPYEGQPTLAQFTAEVNDAGFAVKEVVPTGAPWIAQKYFVLEKR